MAVEVLSVDSDNLVRLDLLTNASTGAYINNATVTFNFKDQNGNLLVGPVSMTNVNATGRYEGTLLQSAYPLVAETSYLFEITANSSGTILFRRLYCIAKVRAQN
jgi:hypothetical protein